MKRTNYWFLLRCIFLCLSSKSILEFEKLSNRDVDPKFGWNFDADSAIKRLFPREYRKKAKNLACFLSQ